MKIKIEDEYFDTGEKDEEGEFVKVPIENNQSQPIEIFNTDNNIFKSFITKLKNKYYIVIIIILILILFIIAKRLIFNVNNTNNILEESKPSNIIDTINEDENYSKDNIDNNNNNNLKNENLFYISQNKEKINMKSFSSSQLKNPQNIKLIENLEISLDLEYENFIHLKIKDSSTKRW